MKATKEYVNLRDEGLPFNIWITACEPLALKHHWHEFTEILYLLEGEAVQRINTSSCKIQQGDLIIINGLDMHSTYTEPDKQARFLVLQLPPAFISLFYRDAKKFRITNNFYIHRQLTNPTILQTNECMNNIAAELEKKEPGYPYFLASHVYKLLGMIYRYAEVEHFHEKQYKEQKFILERLSPVISFIEDHYRDKITLDEACSKVGLSPQYFCKNFKKATTYTFIEYMNLLRVQYAQDQLASSDLSITEIAYAAGFSSIAYFNRSFKKVTGIKPSQFRRK